MKPVKFHPQAESELAGSVDFYNEHVLGLGDDFFVKVKLASRQIQANPLRRPLRSDGTRQARLLRFPYSVVYRDQSEQIEIIAVAHSSRRPGYWRNRL